ncbi:hypothetical protein LCGC14_2442450, partial [marine sediment metagenome]
ARFKKAWQKLVDKVDALDGETKPKKKAKKVKK